jgi:hypothetical protein
LLPEEKPAEQQKTKHYATQKNTTCTYRTNMTLNLTFTFTHPNLRGLFCNARNALTLITSRPVFFTLFLIARRAASIASSVNIDVTVDCNAKTPGCKTEKVSQTKQALLKIDAVV